MIIERLKFNNFERILVYCLNLHAYSSTFFSSYFLLWLLLLSLRENLWRKFLAHHFPVLRTMNTESK
uniref:Uncharacterized protein n=1 Tax=Arundo donax TaxID=35708 RepID=A0A0A9C296_ARUDO